MAFSASTCITNLGSTPLGPILSAYTDTDSYLNPFSSVNTSQINGVNCPYIFTNIPDGTTNIRLIDPTNSCCITIPIQSDNFCNTCDLDFNYYPLQTNSQILAGDLTGSCQANISDYVINWYGPNSATNIAFRSGKGNTFSYQFTHPLTGSGFVFAQAGTYTPVIDRVIISGITFSHTGGTGTYDATLDCFNSSSVQVNPLTCDNGNTPASAYTHSYYFSGTGASAIPLNVTFQLSANTNYFAYSFTGQTVPDTLKIFYSGGTTPSQILLENLSVGTQNSNNLSWANQRTISGPRFSKVLCLTGLTRIPNDSLIIQITPNAGNTEWALGLRCFSSFDCNTCQTQTIQSNNSYKIIKSAITVVTASCYTNIGIKLSGCGFSSYSGNQIYNYWAGGKTVDGPVGWFFQNTYALDNDEGIIPRSGTSFSTSYYQNAGIPLSWTSTSCNVPNTSLQTSPNFTVCSTNTTPGTFSFTKYVSGGTPSVGVIQMTFSNTFWLNHYYNNYLTKMSEISSWSISSCTSATSFYPNAITSNPINGPFSGGTSANNIPSYLDPQDNRYYRSFYFCVPSATGTTPCFGNSGTELGGSGFVGNAAGGLAQCYFIHPSATVTTGITGSNYYMIIVMNTAQKGVTFTNCEIGCDSGALGLVQSVNNNSTGTTNNITFTSSVPAAFISPIALTGTFGYSTTLEGTVGSFSATCNTTKRLTNNGSIVWYDIQNYTIPQNPSNNNALLNYSAVTCPNLLRWSTSINTTQTSLNSPQGTTLSLYGYYIELLNESVNGPLIPPANTAFTQVYKNYEIYSMPITNGIFAGNTIPNNSFGSINTVTLTPQASNPNWVLVYRFRYGVQEFCNSTYVVGC